MIKMEMGQKHIGNITSVKAQFLQGAVERMFSVQEIMGKKLLALLISDARVDKCKALAILDQQASHGQVYHIVAVSRIGFLPDTLRNDAKHSTAVKFEMPCFDGVKFHWPKIKRVIPILHAIRKTHQSLILKENES